MKRKENDNLYNNEREHEEVLREGKFLEQDTEENEDYWLDDDEDNIEDQDEGEEPEETEDDLTEEYPDNMEESNETPDEKDSAQEDAAESFQNKTVKFTTEKKKMKKKKKKRVFKKKILKTTGITVGAVALAYLGVSAFFVSHYFYDTSINGKDFSFRSASYVENYLKNQADTYILKIIDKNGGEELIPGKDIALECVSVEGLQEALVNQNPFLWPEAFLKERVVEAAVTTSFDERSVERIIDELQILKIEQTEPANAYPKYDGEQFVIEPEVLGNAVNVNELEDKVNQYLTEFKPELDMVEEKCYKLPEYTTESEKLQNICAEMNKYLRASVTYTMKEDVVVDKALTNKWISADENMKVVFDEEAVKTWLAEFGKKYDTVGTARTITSPVGETIEVSGGDYGWEIDEEKELKALIDSIKKGEVVEREPIYYQTAASHDEKDWGTTYAEVDISSQHMWMIVEGKVVLESDVVTGTPIPSRETTRGVYAMKDILYNTVLVGAIVPSTGEPEYRTPVSYWMCITSSGIGFHDATWQPAFGGELYMYGYGSHGCVNMPYDKAGALIEMVYTGMPVIIHD